MSERHRSTWLIFASTGVALGVLSVFFLAIGTARAGEWAQIIGTLVGIAALGVTVYSVVLMRRPAPAPSKKTPGSVRNTVSGDVHGGIVQARDIGASPDEDGDRTASGGGTTENEIKGGAVTGFVIQARDIKDPGVMRADPSEAAEQPE
ncbi:MULTISPECIES: hypothetical protein [Nonomuraea]|uniref:Superfamily III holin-X n=1 Tax=Nonomuraea ferruginea TaxID=46174 RepID=A0ABT4T3D9_9ACTN|nr:hypothetical protein [Nonomuraea ferruginea]MDA0643934.1 hypothetical protein [Nonomuraea ferruginea]